MPDEPKANGSLDPLRGLESLPPHDVASERAEAIWQAASAAFAAAGPPWWRRLGDAYRLVLEPVLALALCILYLSWAVGQVSSLYGQSGPGGEAAAEPGPRATSADHSVAGKLQKPSDLPG